MYRTAWQPLYYSNNNSNVPIYDSAASFHYIQMNQMQLIRLMEKMQSQIEDIQEKMGTLEQNQSPKNTYIHNDFDFDKFEVYLDSVDVDNLTGSLQIGLFNGMIPQPGIVPAPGSIPLPAETLPEATPIPPSLAPPAGVPTTTPIPPIPPGVAPPAGVPTFIPPGLTLPSGAVPITPEIAILPPATTPVPPATPRGKPFN